MTLDEYQKEAKRTAPRSLDAYPKPVQIAFKHALGFKDGDDLLKTFDVLIWGQGLAGEAGEVCDLLKKVHGHGKPYDGDQLKKELGDVLWYLANLADAHGFTLSEVAQANVDKLRARYPVGFSVQAAAAKADEKHGGPCVHCHGEGFSECGCAVPESCVGLAVPCDELVPCPLHKCDREQCFCPGNL
jgi:NTP pyrophosphatase (non-canonical NTP hydrolase)